MWYCLCIEVYILVNRILAMVDLFGNREFLLWPVNIYGAGKARLHSRREGG